MLFQKVVDESSANLHHEHQAGDHDGDEVEVKNALQVIQSELNQVSRSVILK